MFQALPDSAPSSRPADTGLCVFEAGSERMRGVESSSSSGSSTSSSSASSGSDPSTSSPVATDTVSAVACWVRLLSSNSSMSL